MAKYCQLHQIYEFECHSCRDIIRDAILISIVFHYSKPQNINIYFMFIFRILPIPASWENHTKYN